MTAPRVDAEGRDVFIVANNVEELGGVQRVAHNLATLLGRRGHRVRLVGIDHAVTAHDYGEHDYPVHVLNDVREPAVPRAGLVRSRLDPRVRLAAGRKRRMRQAAVDRLSALFREAPNGIVIVLQVWAMNWVAEADTRHLHVIGMSHESYDAALNSARYGRIQRLYQDVDLFLLLTEQDARRFEADGFNNVGVMHNPLSFYPDTASDLSSKVVVAAGRYAPEKGYDRLIDAFALVAPDHPDWSLAIFGHGPLHGELAGRAAALGLSDRVTLPGLAEDIATELRKASVFALSSIHEGLPMALAEAMACGVPCVAFDCAPGVREIVADGEDGLVVPPRNVPALADGLRRLMADDDLRRRYGARARENIRRFTPEQIGEDWEKVFALVER